MQDSLAIRQWSARFLAMIALILTGAAAYTLTLIPLQTRIPLDWLQRIYSPAPAQIGAWGLFIAPAALFILALVMRGSQTWLPARPARRKAVWICIFIVNLLVAALQYLLARDAIAVAAIWPG